MTWGIAAACAASAATEAFERKCAGLPKEEVDKLRAERAERTADAFVYTSSEPEQEKPSKWMMVKYYTAKLALLFFRKWRITIFLLMLFIALIGLAQHETINEPENSASLYELQD